jgi:membrane protease YdiL (CAAX protease family)
MKKIADWNAPFATAIGGWIKRHPVAAFFILAFIVAWPLFILIFFVFPGNQLLMLSGFFAVFTPALAAMLVSAVVNPQPKLGSSKPRWITFGVAWLLSTVIMTLYYWHIQQMKLAVAVVVWAIVALLPAWVLSSAFARTPGIRRHFSTLLKPRGNILWYLVAFFTVPVLQLLGMGITRLLGGEVQFRLPGGSLDRAVIFFVLTFLSGFLCSGGINEESGWRGFALPRLQARFPVIAAIAIVWFFWALWHIPYDIGLKSDPGWMLLNRTLFNFTFSVLFAWVYNRTKGSILAPAIFHPAMNTFGNNLPLTPAAMVLFVALAAFAIVSGRMWKKLPPDDLAVYQAAEAPGMGGASPGPHQAQVAG